MIETMPETAPPPRVEKLLIAGLRGFCAGVVRAIDVVEKALAVCDGPVYVRKEIIHNRYVVDELRRKGARFVDEVDDAPEGSWLVYSAHGVSPEVRDNARRRGLRTIDATCPLVTKVHAQARRYADAGYAIVLIGHAGHEEVEGTLGEAPGSILLVESPADAERIALPDDRPLAYVTQTTLSVDETHEIVSVLRRRFPQIEGPAREDICYATSNRQWAVKEMLPQVDMLIAIGSQNSSNSKRLVEVARAHGVPAELIDDETELDEAWFEGVGTLGITSGASAPEHLVDRVCDWFRARGVAEITNYAMVQEDVEFRLPVELRRELELAASQD